MTPETPTPEKEETPETIIELFGKKFIKSVSNNGRVELKEISEE